MNDSPRFHRPGQRAAIRTSRPWHRLAFIIRKLPEAIEAEIRALNLPDTAKVLDYGCADRPYQRFLPAGAEYVGADLTGNPDADVYLLDDGRVPLGEAQFDAVLSTQVLEHVVDPSLYIAECARLLRPGGRLLLTTHGLMVYHPDPVDYWRWTSAGLRHQVERSGLRVLSTSGVMGLGATGLQLFQDALWGRLHRRLRPPFAWFMQSLIALVDHFETPAARAMNALVFVVVAEKIDGERGAVPPAV